MSAFNGFPELPGPEEVAFCKLNEVYCCDNIRYGNISTFTNAVRLEYYSSINLKYIHSNKKLNVSDEKAPCNQRDP